LIVSVVVRPRPFNVVLDKSFGAPRITKDILFAGCTLAVGGDILNASTSSAIFLPRGQFFEKPQNHS
jgi:hypothetical protein